MIPSLAGELLLQLRFEESEQPAAFPRAEFLIGPEALEEAAEVLQTQLQWKFPSVFNEREVGSEVLR